MSNYVFTIVAKNYIGLAQILEKSIKEYYSNFQFYIVIADEIGKDIQCNLPDNIVVAKENLDISESQWNDISFKYNLTEFCTSIKPSAFKFFMDKSDCDKVIYLDPDIYFYSSIGQIFDILDSCDILLTPHITQIADKLDSDAPENAWLSCGIFNLGFCGLRNGNAARKMVSWWHQRLIDKCYIDGNDFYFTDQKWMDFLPSFFTADQLRISMHLGMNLAPWNFFERKILDKDGILTVEKRQGQGDLQSDSLIFVHYSGYDYNELKKGNVVQKNIPNINDYSDVRHLTATYKTAIQAQSETFDNYICQDYSYNVYDNGDKITQFHRRLYRSLSQKGTIFNNLFSCDSGSFYSLLRSKGMIITTNLDIDKATKHNLQSVGRKLRFFNKITRFAYKIMGYQRYLLLIRLLRPFARYEAQIHLLDKEFDDKNIY